MLRVRFSRRVAGIILGLATAFTAALVADVSPALAHNPGDFWLTNVNTTVDRGHDPHLDYADINMLAAYPGATGGTFTITAVAPTSVKKGSNVVYSGVWSYDNSKPDPQIVAVVNVKTLIDNTTALQIKAQPKQGYHFKLACTTDGSKNGTTKSKTFWVAAAPIVQPSPSPSPGASPSPSASPSPAGGQLGASTQTGSNIPLAETGGPILAAGLILLLIGGIVGLSSRVVPGRR